MVYRFRTGRKPVDGTLILVLGIVSLVACPLIGPIAWSMGNRAMADIKEGVGDQSERGKVETGLLCARIATILFLTPILGFIFLFIVFGVWASH